MAVTADVIKSLKLKSVSIFNVQLVGMQLGRPYKKDPKLHELINYISYLESGCVNDKYVTTYYLRIK